MADRVQVIGADRLAASLHAAGADLGNLEATNSRVGAYVVGQASMAAPRRTGRLAGSIRVLATTGTEAQVGSTLVYAPVIHNGWPRHGISANPFLVVPAENTMPTWSDYYAQQVVAIVGRIRGA